MTVAELINILQTLDPTGLHMRFALGLLVIVAVHPLTWVVAFIWVLGRLEKWAKPRLECRRATHGSN